MEPGSDRSHADTANAATEALAAPNDGNGTPRKRTKANGAGGPPRKSTELELRKRPTQARGTITFNAILDTTARLLDDIGADALTTNLVAEVAGVNIATLYQYFPSKESILLALFRRDTDARIASAAALVRRLDGVDDLRQIVSEVVDVLVRLRSSVPGAAALRRAMQSLPELQAYERETMLASGRFVAEQLIRRVGVREQRLDRVGLVVMETITALLDVWSLEYAEHLGDDGDWIVLELKELLIRYLTPLIAQN